jgi:hypothetical protein
MEHLPDYAARLWAVTQLGRRFPGVKNSRRSGATASSAMPEDLGLFAGIYLQTKWQQDSGRDAWAIWHVVNESLTLVPYECYREYSANSVPPVPVREDIARRAWKEYFRTADRVAILQKSPRLFGRVKGFVLARFLLPRKLWRAHVLSMRQAIVQNRELLSKPMAPAEELAFWRGWVRFVMVSGLLAPPTTDFVLGALLEAAMPPHAPLGASAARDQGGPLLRRSGLVLLKAYGRNEKRFFASFTGYSR